MGDIRGQEQGKGRMGQDKRPQEPNRRQGWGRVVTASGSKTGKATSAAANEVV